MEFESQLTKAGLAGNEAKVYLELLKKGKLSANEISKKISMDRTLTYTVLNHLIEKGMVNYVIKNNKKFFQSADPSNLLNKIKEKEEFVKDLIKSLKQIETVKEVEQEVNIYEGKEGLRTFTRLFIKHNSALSFGATGRAYDFLYESPAIAKELVKKGFKAKIITSPKYKKHSMIKIKGIQTKFLDIKSEATTSIFGDYIAIHILTQKPLIILIKNKEIAESYKNHFEVLWHVAKS